MRIPSIPADKAQHFFYGALASLLVVLCLIVCSLWWPSALSAAPFFGILFGAVLGVATEVRQDVLNEEAWERGEQPTHSVDSRDTAVTAFGGLVPALPLLLLWLMSKFL